MPESQLTVNGETPPSHETVSVTDWPESIDGDEGLRLENVNCVGDDCIADIAASDSTFAVIFAIFAY